MNPAPNHPCVPLLPLYTITHASIPRSLLKISAHDPRDPHSRSHQEHHRRRYRFASSPAGALKKREEAVAGENLGRVIFRARNSGGASGSLSIPGCLAGGNKSSRRAPGAAPRRGLRGSDALSSRRGAARSGLLEYQVIARMKSFPGRRRRRCRNGRKLISSRELADFFFFSFHFSSAPPRRRQCAELLLLARMPGLLLWCFSFAFFFSRGFFGFWGESSLAGLCGFRTRVWVRGFWLPEGGEGLESTF